MTIQRIELLDALLERDLADMDLDGLIATITAHMPGDAVDKILHAAVRDAIRIVGPELFRNAYYLGARVGMEIATEIHREGRK
jgi:hypothetical protein